MTDPQPPTIPPGFLHTWCHTLAEGTESPPEAYLPTGLALLSAIAGPRLHIQWNAAHTERCNLWILNVGASALARKTSGLAGLRQAAKWATNGDDIRLLNVTRISDAGLVNSLDVVGPDTLKAQAEHPDPTTTIDPVTRPVPVSWIAIFNEIAPVWTDQGSTWAMDTQRTLLTIYDGRLGSTTRNTNVPDQECFVTAIGNIPPGVLRDNTTLQMLSSGFVGRWIAIPTPSPTRTISFPPEAATDPLRALERQVTHLAGITRRRTHHTVNTMWDPGARNHRDTWYREHHHHLNNHNPDDPYTTARAELWGRAQATALKIATLAAVATHGPTANDLADIQVTVDESAWAHQIVDQSIAFIVHALEQAGADSATTKGKTEGRVLRYLERVGATSQQTAVTYRDVTDACKGGATSRADILAAIEALYAAGDIDVQPQGRSNRIWRTARSAVVEFPQKAA